MSKRASIQAKDGFIENSKIRYYKALDYLSLFIYIVAVTACALLVDIVIIWMLGFVVSAEIATYPIVATFYSIYKIGSAFLIILIAIIHSFFSAASQIKFEYENFKHE